MKTAYPVVSWETEGCLQAQTHPLPHHEIHQNFWNEDTGIGEQLAVSGYMVNSLLSQATVNIEFQVVKCV